MTKQEEIKEELARLEHEQWVAWSKAVAEEVSLERLTRWEKLWVAYDGLTEEQKDQDRKWADRSLGSLHSQGVVIKVDRELPKSIYGDDLPAIEQLISYQTLSKMRDAEESAQRRMLDAGYVAVEPLIEGV